MKCFEKNNVPPGYTPVEGSKCHPDEESCAAACPPVEYGGVCAYREEEEYCGPFDELPGVRGDWCRVVDVPDDKSCADKGAAFCCDAYSDDLKTLRDQFLAYTVGSQVTGFSFNWQSLTGPFVITSISGSTYTAEAPTDTVQPARISIYFRGPTNFIYGCRAEAEASFYLPIVNKFGEGYGFRFSYDSRKGILEFNSAGVEKISFGGKEFNVQDGLGFSEKFMWKQNWTTFVAADPKDSKDNRNVFSTITAANWNDQQSLAGELNIAGFGSDGMPRPDEIVSLEFSWPDLFTRKISPPNPYWYCSGKNYLVKNYCPTDDLDLNTTYYSTEEEALYACTAVSCAYSDYSWECFKPSEVPEDYYITDPDGLFCIREGSACDQCCDQVNNGHVGYKVAQAFADNPIKIGDAAPFTYTGEGPFAVQGDLVCVGIVGDAYIFEDSDPQKPYWCTALKGQDAIGNDYCYQSCGPGPVNATSERFGSCDECNEADCTDKCFDPDIGPKEECDPDAEYVPFLHFALTILKKEVNSCYGASLSMTYNNHEGMRGYVNFNGKNVYAQTEAGSGGTITGSFAGNSVPFAEVNCTGFNNDTPQDDMKGPLEWQHFQPANPLIGTTDQTYSFSLQYDDVLQSPCWLCPDQPKPTRNPGNPAYPGTFSTTGGRTMPTKTNGPGTELANMLKMIGINSKEKGCQCKSHAKRMDREGPQWCRDNIDTILGWLQTEAKKRKLPFVKQVAKQVVLLAIRRAEKKS
ncbi:MAG: hypothetical protein ACR2NI_08250 [Pirellulales bacterium]